MAWRTCIALHKKWTKERGWESPNENIKGDSAASSSPSLSGRMRRRRRRQQLQIGRERESERIKAMHKSRRRYRWHWLREDGPCGVSPCSCATCPRDPTSRKRKGEESGQSKSDCFLSRSSFASLPKVPSPPPPFPFNTDTHKGN